MCLYVGAIDSGGDKQIEGERTACVSQSGTPTPRRAQICAPLKRPPPAFPKPSRSPQPASNTSKPKAASMVPYTTSSVRSLGKCATSHPTNTTVSFLPACPRQSGSRGSEPSPGTVNTYCAFTGLTPSVPFHAKPARCCPAGSFCVPFHGGRSNRRRAVSSRLLEVPQGGGYLEAVHHGRVALDHERVPLPIAIDQGLQHLLCRVGFCFLFRGYYIAVGAKVVVVVVIVVVMVVVCTRKVGQVGLRGYLHQKHGCTAFHLVSVNK